MTDGPSHAITFATTMPTYRYEILTGLVQQEVYFQLKSIARELDRNSLKDRTYCKKT